MADVPSLASPYANQPLPVTKTTGDISKGPNAGKRTLGQLAIQGLVGAK